LVGWICLGFDCAAVLRLLWAVWDHAKFLWTLRCCVFWCVFHRCRCRCLVLGFFCCSNGMSTRGTNLYYPIKVQGGRPHYSPCPRSRHPRRVASQVAPRRSILAFTPCLPPLSPCTHPVPNSSRFARYGKTTAAALHPRCIHLKGLICGHRNNGGAPSYQASPPATGTVHPAAPRPHLTCPCLRHQ
jgi:hypothetical protein